MSALKLSVTGLGDEKNSDILFEIRNSLTELGIQAEFAASRTETGARGDFTSFSEIFVALISSGTFIAFINCLKTFLSRERKLSIEIKTRDGGSIRLDSQNINYNDVVSVIQTLQEGGQ